MIYDEATGLLICDRRRGALLSDLEPLFGIIWSSSLGFPPFKFRSGFGCYSLLSALRCINDFFICSFCFL